MTYTNVLTGEEYEQPAGMVLQQVRQPQEPTDRRGDVELVGDVLARGEQFVAALPGLVD